MPKPQILVIDDEEALVKSIERALRKDYNLTVAYNGRDGLELAHQVQPDLIILDIMMPGMDGFETCRELRKAPLLKSIPVLFLSALSAVDSRISGFEAGADDYLIKPFDVRELLLRIKAILRRHQPGQPAPAQRVLKQGHIILNCQTFEAKTPTGAHHLTPIEFDLLYHFMSYPGQVFSSVQLLQEVWKYPADTGSTDLVRMHIKNLRDKIEPDPQKPIYLKTIPRHGYILPLSHNGL